MGWSWVARHEFSVVELEELADIEELVPIRWDCDECGARAGEWCHIKGRPGEKTLTHQKRKGMLYEIERWARDRYITAEQARRRAS